jgi:peptide deformylase
MLTLVPEDHPILKQRTPIFDFENPPIDPRWLVGEMLSAMERERGIGLAAPQVNYPLRVFVMQCRDRSVRACFNPEIIGTSKLTVKDEEGCLSFPGIFLKVSRHMLVEVRYQDADGNLVNETFADIDARCYLHESDHLNGVTFVTLVSRLARQRAEAKRSK